MSSTNKSLKMILINMNLEAAYRESLLELGYDLDELYKLDEESRNQTVKNVNNKNLDNYNPYNYNIQDMAESLIDSLATLELPAWGYGMRYKFGNIKLYKKSLKNDYQPKKLQDEEDRCKKKDFSKNPLEIQRFDFAIRV